MTTLHMDPETVRLAAREMNQGGEQMAQSVQALNRSMRALRTAWVGGGSEEFGIQTQELVAQMEALAISLNELADRVDREATEWEETDRRGAGNLDEEIVAGGMKTPSVVSIAGLTIGLPTWLISFIDKFFPSSEVISPLANESVAVSSMSSSVPQEPEVTFGDLIEKARLENERRKKPLSPQPLNLAKYPREDDGSYLAGQEKPDSCAITSTKMALYQAAGIEANESDLRIASHKEKGGYGTIFDPNKQQYWGTSPLSLDDLVNNVYGDKVVAKFDGTFDGAVYGNGTQMVEELKDAANAGKGIVVTMVKTESAGASYVHSVNIVGVKTEGGHQVVLINDPEHGGQRLAVPVEEFESAWYGDALYISKKT
jgi:WXG100 family type VII secretion target